MSENLKNLNSASGATKRRARKGRGIASGAGKTSGRGMRGQKCRSGYSKKPWREGGQTPLYRRLPKRQVNTRINRKEYSTINLSDIQALAEEGITEISLLVLEEAGMIKKLSHMDLRFGAGELNKAVTVKANKFSLSAKEAIEKAGGKAIEV